MELANGVYNIDAKSFADPYGNGVQRFDRLTKCVQLAVKGLGDNTTSAIEVAKALYTIREEKLYENYPVPGTNYLSVFEDFVSFAKAFFCAGKSTIYNYIALYERFGADSKAEENPQNTFDVSKYTYTQLLLLLSLRFLRRFARFRNIPLHCSHKHKILLRYKLSQTCMAVHSQTAYTLLFSDFSTPSLLRDNRQSRFSRA